MPIPPYPEFTVSNLVVFAGVAASYLGVQRRPARIVTRLTNYIFSPVTCFLIIGVLLILLYGFELIFETPYLITEMLMIGFIFIIIGTLFWLIATLLSLFHGFIINFSIKTKTIAAIVFIKRKLRM